MTPDPPFIVSKMESADLQLLQAELKRRQKRLLYSIALVLLLFYGIPFAKAYGAGRPLDGLPHPAYVLRELALIGIALGAAYYHLVYKLKAAMRSGEKFTISGKVKRKTSLSVFSFTLTVRIADGITEDLEVPKHVYRSVSKGDEIILEYPYGSKTLIRHSLSSAKEPFHHNVTG